MDNFADFLERMVRATAWTMEKPKAYGPFHLTFFIVGLAVSIAAAWLLRKADDKTNRRLLVGLGIFLMVAELYRQIFYYFIMGDRSIQWWTFPFQLCDVPMYLCVIAPLLKKGAVQKGMYNFMLLFNLLGGFLAFIEPSGIVHEYWFLTLHAFIWHMLLVFIGLYLAFSKRADTTRKDYLGAAATFVALCVVAFGLNILCWDVSKGSMNMFFVGPANSSLIVFKDIAKNYGWYVSTALYIPVVCLGAYLVCLACRGIKALGAKMKKA